MRGFAELILPVSHFTACMEAKDTCQGVERSLCQVINSFATGPVAFEVAYRDLQNNKVQDLTNPQLKKLIPKHVTVATIEKARQEFVRETSEAGRSPKELTQKRVAKVEYRGCCIFRGGDQQLLR